LEKPACGRFSTPPKALDSQETFSFTSPKLGECEYFCSIHPHMTGKVIVTRE
jgi:plastocyanin